MSCPVVAVLTKSVDLKGTDSPKLPPPNSWHDLFFYNNNSIKGKSTIFHPITTVDIYPLCSLFLFGKKHIHNKNPIKIIQKTQIRHCVPAATNPPFSKI